MDLAPFLDAHHAQHDSDPTTNQGRFKDAEHVSVVHLGLAPLKTAPEGCSRAPARYMPTASPALCRGLDGIFEVCHANHGSDPTTNLGRFRDAEHIPAVYLGLAPLKTAPASRPHSPARCMSNASPALCHGLDVIFKAHHAKHGRDPTATQGQPRGAEHVSAVHLGPAPSITALESPARRMSTAGPALSYGLDVIFEAHHAQHRRDTTATRGRFRGAGQVSAAYWGPAPA